MADLADKSRKQTLKVLKARLGALEGPEDNTVATNNFYKKHKTVEHPDPAGNGDDVFKASNVRTVNRSPDHGYNPGEDAAVYEGYDVESKAVKRVKRNKDGIYENAMKDFATKMDDMESMPNHPIWDESHPNHESAKRTLKNAPDSPQKRRIVKELGRDLKPGGEMQHHQSQYDITESMPYFGSRSKLRDRIAAGKLGKSHAGPIRGGRTSEPHPNPPYDPNSKSKHERDMYAVYMYNFNREKKRSWRPTLSIEEVFGLSKKEKAKKTAEKIMRGPQSPWKKAKDAKDAVDAARYYGTLKQSYCDPRIYDIFAHLSEENKELFLQVLGEEDGYERIAEAFGLTEEE